MAATNEGIDAAAVMESEGGSGEIQITEKNGLPSEVMANRKKVTLGSVRGELFAAVVDENKRVRVVDTVNGNVFTLSNSASSAVLNSEGKLAGHNGNQVFLLSIDGNRDVEKSHDYFDYQNTLLMKWITSKRLVIVTKVHVYYWDVKSSTQPVVKVRNHRLSGSILDFSVSHDGTYGLVRVVRADGTALLLFQMKGNSKRNTFHALAGTFATCQSNVVLIMASFNKAGSIIVEARELGRSGAGGNPPRAWGATIPVQVQEDSKHMNLIHHLYCHGERGFVVANSGVYVISLTSGKMLAVHEISGGERILCARGISGTIHVITNDRVLSINHVEGHEEKEEAGEEQVTTVNGTISGIVGGNDSAVGAPDPTPELPDPPGQKKTVLSSPESTIVSRPRVDPPGKEDTISVSSDASTEQEEKKEEDDVEAEEDEQVHRDGRELEGRNVDSPVQREQPRADLSENEADSSYEYHGDADDEQEEEEDETEEEEDETEDDEQAADLSHEENEQDPEELHLPLAAPAPAAPLHVPRGNVTRQRRPTMFTTVETIEGGPLRGWTHETRHSANRPYNYFTSPGNVVMMKSLKGAKAFANILMEAGVRNEEDALVLFRAREIAGLYRDHV
eukprot:scaffold18034_cov93-Skeletonema_dohrnii-CCMP3373.AAC.2